MNNSLKNKKIVFLSGGAVLGLFIFIGGLLLTKTPTRISTPGHACEFYSTPDGILFKLYISGSKMRGDYTIPWEVKTINGHVFTNDKEMYYWTEGSAIGFKTSLTSLNDLVGPTPKQAEDSDWYNDFNCSSAVVDSSLLFLPLGVQFLDFDTILISSPSDSPRRSTQKCSACDSLTGDTQMICYWAFDC